MSGIQLQLMIGRTVPTPAPAALVEALQSVEVTHADEGRSGFQITFHVGRSGMFDLLDYQFLSHPSLKPFNRVILVVIMNAVPTVLMDGIITNQQLTPSDEPGGSTLSITGEDVSVMMDLDERSALHPGLPQEGIVKAIIAQYSLYGLIPDVQTPKVSIPPPPAENVPVQYGTDLSHIKHLAEQNGFVFYVTPGRIPTTNIAYWGPPVRLGVPQRALSVNMGPASNVNSINFQYNALEPTLVTGQVLDNKTYKPFPIETLLSTRLPLAAISPLLGQAAIRLSLLQETQNIDATTALARAQAKTDASFDKVVTASGELNALRYGDVLQPRALVDLRGAGYTYDGTYYVKNVTHSISPGEYKQRFSLSRDSVGALKPMVRP